jgi:hypothetical protein
MVVLLQGGHEPVDYESPHARRMEAMVVLLQGGHELEDSKGTVHFQEVKLQPKRLRMPK